ncbi:hypothetical protein ACQ3I4_09815 [Zafaria sp. Z1313]|uniref:hypothetical protein n=1 Tax=unclassified Zafaria TaxID=2828765 RepID=UPI002E773468|nr:hypothetical protein [Zafaria sp. J156]MEE1621784.1 hypothetical protein [Zafaria sp. J156]
MSGAKQVVPAQGARGILAFDVPEPWRAEAVRPEVELFAAMPPVENEFTPNVVVTVNPFDGSLADFSRRAMTGIEAQLREGRIVHTGRWAYTFADPDEEGGLPLDALGVPVTAHEGRVIEYTHRAPNGRTVSGADYLVLLKGWAVQISTTSSIQARFIFDEPFEAMARSVRVLRSPQADDAVASQAGPTAAAGRVDEQASADQGTELEELFGHLAAGADLGTGVWMSGAAIARTGELKDGVVGRLGGADPVLDELRDLGVLDGGRLGGMGSFMAQALTEAPVRLRLTGRFLDGETSLQAFVHGGNVLLAAEQGYGPRVLNQPWHPDDPARFNVQVLPITELTSAMARWAGVGPAWNLHVAPFVIEAALVDQRLGGEAAVPHGAGALLREAWGQPWFTWVLEAEGPSGGIDPVTYVNAGPRGHFRIGTVEDPSGGADRVGLWATESSFIFRQFEDALQAVVHGRPVVLG